MRPKKVVTEAWYHWSITLFTGALIFRLEQPKRPQDVFGDNKHQKEPLCYVIRVIGAFFPYFYFCRSLLQISKSLPMENFKEKGHWVRWKRIWCMVTSRSRTNVRQEPYSIYMTKMNQVLWPRSFVTLLLIHRLNIAGTCNSYQEAKEMTVNCLFGFCNKEGLSMCKVNYKLAEVWLPHNTTKLMRS